MPTAGNQQLKFRAEGPLVDRIAEAVRNAGMTTSEWLRLAAVEKLEGKPVLALPIDPTVVEEYAAAAHISVEAARQDITGTLAFERGRSERLMDGCTHPRLIDRNLPAWCPDCRKTVPR
jgi:hypothetical protein